MHDSTPKFGGLGHWIDGVCTWNVRINYNHLSDTSWSGWEDIQNILISVNHNHVLADAIFLWNEAASYLVKSAYSIMENLSVVGFQADFELPSALKLL